MRRRMQVDILILKLFQQVLKLSIWNLKETQRPSQDKHDQTE